MGLFNAIFLSTIHFFVITSQKNILHCKILGIEHKELVLR